MNRKRNGHLVDIWSLAHFVSGFIFALFLPPIPALLLLAAWEPFENLVVSPLVWRFFRINFGHESFKNAVSDIVFDAFGIAFALLLMSPF